jgi:hypothetical protein
LKRQLLETRDARDLQRQELRQDGKDATAQNPRVLWDSMQLGEATCGISSMGAKDSAVQGSG